MNKNELMLTKDVVDIANAFYASGMFPDVKSGAQAIVKIQAGQEFGIPPFAAMTGIHIIQGKPTVGGGLIASKVKSSDKYDYKILEKTDKICRIEFFEEGKSVGIEKFDVADATRAGTQNMTKYPANMLFNRCISNGQKAYAPDVFFGPAYTPEEFGVTEDAAADVSTNTDKTQVAVPMTIVPQAAKKTLLFDSEEYNKAIEFLKSGGSVEKLRVRYDIGPQLEKEMTDRARQTTQEDIHKSNSTYVAPVSAATDAEELTADPF